MTNFLGFLSLVKCEKICESLQSMCGFSVDICHYHHQTRLVCLSWRVVDGLYWTRSPTLRYLEPWELPLGLVMALFGVLWSPRAILGYSNNESFTCSDLVCYCFFKYCVDIGHCFLDKYRVVYCFERMFK